MTGFRRRHVVLREHTAPCSLGFPDMSSHSRKPWTSGYGWDDHVVGILFAGRKAASGCGAGSEETDDLVYLAVNAFWEPQQIELPSLAENRFWRPVVDTARGEYSIVQKDEPLDQGIYICGARSVVIFTEEGD